MNRRSIAGTEDNRDFSVGFGERVGNTKLGEDDDGAIEGRPEPRNVGVPEESPPLPHNGEVVDVAAPCRDGALSHVSRPVSPSAPQLPDAMPELKRGSGCGLVRSSYSFTWTLINMMENTIPVNGDVVGDMVDHLDGDPVAFSGHYPRPRELPVDRHDALRAAESGHVCHLYLQTTMKVAVHANVRMNTSMKNIRQTCSASLRRLVQHWETQTPKQIGKERPQ